MVVAKSLVHLLLASSPTQKTALERGTPVKRQAPTATDTAWPQDTICGSIIDYANQNLSTNWVFYASDVYDCFTTVPFIDAVGIRFIDYINTTYQFQSTLSYLKDPPASYQQPAIDFEQALQTIRQNVTSGCYQNEYDFEATIQSLFQRVHDSHVSLNAGVLSAFTFGSLYDLMSVSVDGKQPPRVYFKDDVVAYQDGGTMPSAVSTINGQDVVEYLTTFAASQSQGLLEPDADWNSLFYNPVEDIVGSFNLFGWDATLYPGDSANGDNLTFVFENQTVVPANYLAFYLNPDQTGPLTTGGDFYNYFVLGLLPASYNETDSNDTEVDTSLYTPLTSWNPVVEAFPAMADIVQPNLSIAGDGILTGYFYNDISTAVLSIPSFDLTGDAFDSFLNTTSEFITRAKASGLTKVVIDLQQNSGGETLLAFDTFALFFPNIEPFAGSRRRSFDPTENVLGGSITEYWSSLSPDDGNYSLLAASEWVVTDRLNADTDEHFADWPEYYGPMPVHGDNFSLVERYNLSNMVFDEAATVGAEPPQTDSGPPWTSENIIMLTDGTCGSTCALFVEIMNHDAGVRTVVVGGRPTTGPMQAASGSRGARGYFSFDLDDDFTLAQQVNPTANTALRQVRDPNIFTYEMGFNLRDQIREQDTTPLQFKYLAADCRVYFTFANAFNLERLWRDAAAAIWTDPSLCVANSTGFSTTGKAAATHDPPAPAVVTKDFGGFQSGVQAGYISGSGLQDPGRTGSSKPFQPCDDGRPCQGTCQSTVCPSTGASRNVCLPSCTGTGGCGAGKGSCRPSKRQSETKNAGGSVKAGRGGAATIESVGLGVSIGKRFLNGVCMPLKDSTVSC